MDDKQLAVVLGSVDLFDGLSRKVLARIVDSGHVIEHRAGSEIVSAGAPVSGFRAFSPKGVEMHVVLSGGVDVHVNGRQVGTLSPGAYFGEVSLIDGQPRSAGIVAGPEGVKTFALPKWSFDEMLRDHPEIAVPMLRVLAARLRRAEAAGS